MPTPPKKIRDFSSLLEVIAALRGPDGCPWDKEQTHQTLTQYAIEEAHELAEAIDQADHEGIIEELGDLLLQVVLHSEIASQESRFNIHDVIERVTAKMIHRHPHVFSDTKVKNSEEVLKNWAEIKDAEKAENNLKKTDSPFASIPLTLPALLRAQKIGSKTVRYNFDWDHVSQVIEKVEEELGELKEAIACKNQTEQQLELGDLLFSVVQLARHLNFDAEQSLRQTNRKFEQRFLVMRSLVEKENKKFENLPVSELEQYWKKAKNLINQEAR